MNVKFTHEELNLIISSLEMKSKLLDSYLATMYVAEKYKLYDYQLQSLPNDVLNKVYKIKSSNWKEYQKPIVDSIPDTLALYEQYKNLIQKLKYQELTNGFIMA